MWLPLYRRACIRGESGNIFVRYRLPRDVLVQAVGNATLLSYFCAYAWFMSLPRTTVAASNSIFQV